MKSTNWITNLALLALVIGLSVLTYRTNQQNIIDNTKEPLTSLQPDTVSSLLINKRGNQTLIEKQDGVWRITQPISVKANRFRIGSLLKLLTTNNYTRYAIDELDLEQYGLADSKLSVQVDDVNIIFGNTNPINHKRYMLIDNNMVLIDDNFFPLVNSQIGTLVDQKLFGDDVVITKIQTSDFTLSKDAENQWTDTRNASSDDIVKTIQHWENAQSFGVHNYVKRDILDTITITLSDGTTPITFLVTDTDPWLIIARPDLDLEYHFDEDMIDKLFFPTSEPTPTETSQ